MTEIIEIEVDREPEAELEVIEAALKPETVGHGVPGWEAQTVRPEAGCVFSSFEMEGMPEPTAEETVTENGRYPVARLGFLKVQVPQPAGEVELTENRDYDVSGYETAKVRVPQGVFPAGTLPVLSNGSYDVTEFAGVNVAVPIVFGMELLVLELLTVTVDEDFSGVLNGALGALYNLIPDDKKTGGTNTIGIVYASLVDTPETADQLMSWGGHYNAGARNVGRKWDGSKIVIYSNPAINSWTAKLKCGTRYRIAWMRFA